MISNNGLTRVAVKIEGKVIGTFFITVRGVTVPSIFPINNLATL